MAERGLSRHDIGREGFVSESWSNEKVEYEMELVEAAVKSLRSLAQERSERREGFLLCQNSDVAKLMSSHDLEISTLANLFSLMVLKEDDTAPTGCAVAVVNESMSVFLKLQGSVSASAELENLKKKQKQTQAKMMNEPGYQEKVAAHVHKQNVAKQAALRQEELETFEQACQHLEAEAAKTR